jgi:hypothetical protein
MAGLFSKKSKKEKEEKAAAAKNAVAAVAPMGGPGASFSVSGPPASGSVVSSTGPPASTGSIASSTSNLASGGKPGSVTAVTAGHLRDNSSTASEYASQQQYGVQSPSSKSSFDNDKARMYHHQQIQPQQQYHHLQSPGNAVVSASSISTHNSFQSSSGPWISAQVMSTNPFPRFSHTASYVQTGTDIYVFGGVVKDTTQKDMHVIDFRKLLLCFACCT